MNPHKWCLKFADGFLDHFSKLDRKTKNIAFRVLQQLLQADNPLSLPKVRKLVNADALYRIRVGSYRLLFRLEVGEVICEKFTHEGALHAVDIRHRKDVYRNL